MNIQINEEAGIPVIQILGSLNTEDAGSLEEMVDSLIDSRHLKIVLDLSRAKFISSNIYGVFLGAASRLNQAGGKIAIAGAGERIIVVLHLLSMDQFFALYHSKEEALTALKK